MPAPPGAIPVPFRPRLTQFLVGVNVLVFVAMVARGGSPSGFTTDQSLRWGANFGPLTLSTQPWRVWTSNYVHGGLIHIFFNMWCLLNLGALAERVLGPWTYFAAYSACGIAGSLLSLWWHPMTVSVGASGAIFGLAGTMIAAIYLGKLPFPKESLRGVSRSLISFAGYNLLFGFLPGIDNSAHIGGLLMGLALGALLGPFLTQPAEQRVRTEWVIFIATAFFLLGAGNLVKRLNGYVVPFGRGLTALKMHQATQALPDLEAAARQRPRDALVQGVLGATYLQTKHYPQAETALKQTLALKPGDVAAQYDLGLVYGATGRYDDARKAFATVAERRPKNDQAWLMLGSAYRGLHQPTDAEQAFRRAAQLNTGNYKAYRELGWVQLEQDHADDAVQSFRRALQINPKDSDSVLGLGRSYLAKHMTKEAAQTLQQYQALRSSNSGDSQPAGPAATP